MRKERKELPTSSRSLRKNLATLAVPLLSHFPISFFLILKLLNGLQIKTGAELVKLCCRLQIQRHPDGLSFYVLFSGFGMIQFPVYSIVVMLFGFWVFAFHM
jgi:hypothetical protein